MATTHAPRPWTVVLRAPTGLLSWARSRRLLALGVLIVLVAAGVGTWYFTRGGGAASYRTVPASYGTVSESIDATGTIADVNQASLNFGVSGQVTAVNVAVGQTVKSGQVLAQQDTTGLQAAVSSARANLASAQAKLSEDRTGPTPTQTDGAQASISSAQMALTTDGQNVSNTQTSNAQSLAQAQTSIANDQTTLGNDQIQQSNDQASLTAAQEKEANDCQGDAAAASGSSGSGASGSGGSGASGASSSGGTTSAQCGADQSQVTTDQSKVNSDQTATTNAQSALQTAQANLTSTETKNAQSLQSARNSVTSAEQNLANARSSYTDLLASITPADLESDQASVLTAQATLATDEQNLNEATLVSPINGTVAAVSINLGQDVTAGSSTTSSSSSNTSAAGALASLLGGGSSSSSSSSSADITVISPGSYDVSTSVSDSEVGEIKVGDQAVITPDGALTPAYGTVSSVGLLATSSSGVASYPVVIAVTGSPSGLYAGASASVAIIIMEHTDVLTVPTSAIHKLGGASIVYELSNGQEVAHVVQVGAQGTTETQITSGITAGTEVVLANLSAALPGASTGGTGGSGLSGLTGGGGFGGAGGFGGGGGGGFGGGGGGGFGGRG